jgi:hypothetical protein
VSMFSGLSNVNKVMTAGAKLCLRCVAVAISRGKGCGRSKHAAIARCIHRAGRVDRARRHLQRTVCAHQRQRVQFGCQPVNETGMTEKPNARTEDTSWRRQTGRKSMEVGKFSHRFHSCSSPALVFASVSRSVAAAWRSFNSFQIIWSFVARSSLRASNFRSDSCRTTVSLRQGTRVTQTPWRAHSKTPVHLSKSSARTSTVAFSGFASKRSASADSSGYAAMKCAACSVASNRVSLGDHTVVGQ